MTEKIQKILAGRGLGSRREIEQWLRDGRISINGKKAQLGERITLDVQIRIDGKPVRLDPEKATKSRVLIYHKPEGEICTRHDPEERPSVFDHLPLLRNGRWVSIGRLDFNTSGLLLFTNDGALAHRLMHPSSNIEREYAVRIQGQVSPAMLASLKKGIALEDGFAHFTSITDQGGEGSNHWYHVTVGQGRNRVVRRLFESLGVVVSRLIRIRFGSLLLPRALRRGKWDEMTPHQITQFLNPSAASEKPREKRHGKNERPERHEKHAKRRHPGKPASHSSAPPSRRENTPKPNTRKHPFKRDADKSETFRHREKNHHAGRPPHRSSAPTARKDNDTRRPRSTRPHTTDRRTDARTRPRPEKTFSTALSPRNKITTWQKYPDSMPAQTPGRPRQTAVKKRPVARSAVKGHRPIRPPHRVIPAPENRPILSRRKKPES